MGGIVGCLGLWCAFGRLGGGGGGQRGRFGVSGGVNLEFAGTDLF